MRNCDEHRYRTYGWPSLDGDHDGVGCEKNPPPPTASALVDDGGASMVIKVDGNGLSFYGKDFYGGSLPGMEDFDFDESLLRAAFSLEEGKWYPYKVTDNGKLEIDPTATKVELGDGGIFIVNHAWL